MPSDLQSGLKELQNELIALKKKAFEKEEEAKEEVVEKTSRGGKGRSVGGVLFEDEIAQRSKREKLRSVVDQAELIRKMREMGKFEAMKEKINQYHEVAKEIVGNACHGALLAKGFVVDERIVLAESKKRRRQQKASYIEQAAKKKFCERLARKCGEVVETAKHVIFDCPALCGRRSSYLEVVQEEGRQVSIVQCITQFAKNLGCNSA
nr:unnamed protein product [Callosobruchus chinensis]